MFYNNGNYNTAVGVESMYQALGDRNTAFGYGAFGSTTGYIYNSIALGFYAGHYETASNKLFIDAFDRGSEANGRTQSLIYGVMDATPANQILSLGGGGNVGINTISPSEKLEVNGNVKIDAVLKLTPIATPSNPTEGDIYAGTDHHLYYYNGSMWKQLDN